MTLPYIGLRPVNNNLSHLTALRTCAKILSTTEKKFRGISGEEPGMLNKITGCDSRTVPPLYVPIPCFFGESQSLGISLGRRSRVR